MTRCEISNLNLQPYCVFAETISSIPLQLEEDDIDDFCSLAQYYSTRTPQSFRKVRKGS